MTPAERAQYVLEQYWDGNLPVNPAKIALKLGIAVEYSTGSKLSGWYNQEDQTIYVNPHEVVRRQRFTVAHEIGHAVLGHGSSPREASQQYNKNNYLVNERDANDFAAQLLMPKEALSFLIFERKITTIDALCVQFDVSPEAMKIRLSRLGYFS